MEWRRCEYVGCAAMFQGDLSEVEDSQGNPIQVNLCPDHINEDDLWWDGENVVYAE